jgi:hypothetical protein
MHVQSLNAMPEHIVEKCPENCKIQKHVNCKIPYMANFKEHNSSKTLVDSNLFEFDL